MDRWQELINYLDMTAAWVQVIISAFAIIIAMDYLGQHAKKAKIERRYDLILSCIKNISKYVGEEHLMFKRITRHHYLFYTTDTKAEDIVDLIIKDYYEARETMKSTDFLAFEIDAEVKLISDQQIEKLWRQLFDDISSVDLLFSELYRIKGDRDKCSYFIANMPLGILSKSSKPQAKVVESNLNLKIALVKLYREQENKMSYNIFKGFWD